MARILVVDDEVTYAELLALVLTGEGHEVVISSSGSDALARGAQFRPDILISDWKLKDSIDGVEVSRSLQAANPQLQLILISGSASDELLQAAEGLHDFSILEKPCEIDDMCRHVQTAAAR